MWRSLGTVEKDETTYRSLQAEASGQRLFRTLTQHGTRMTKYQIETLIARWLEEALDEAEDARAIGGPMTDEDRDAIHGGLSDQFDIANEALISGNYGKIISEADELLQATGLPALDHTGADFARLCRRLLRAKIEFLRIEFDRWDGEYRDDHRRAATMDSAVPATASLPFTVVLDKYLLATPRPDRTANPLRAEFEKFLGTIGGDRPIGSITRADCVAYKESLQVVRNLSLMTCIKHLSNLETLYKWAGDHDYLPEGFHSPARRLAPSKRQAKKQSVRRRPFTTEELLIVLGSREFLAQRSERPERYWLVLLLLFQGCRREEGAQLYLKDLGVADGGIRTINITDDEEDQTLKNTASKRKVPFHSSLIKLGFLMYVDSIKREGHIRLFPQLDRKGNNGYGDPVGKWFGRLVTSLGLTDPRLVIHSLRRGVITKLHSAGVPVNIAEVITGHSEGTEHEKYVHRDQIAMKTLQKALEKIQFPEVVELLLRPK